MDFSVTIRAVLRARLTTASTNSGLLEATLHSGTSFIQQCCQSPAPDPARMQREMASHSYTSVTTTVSAYGLPLADVSSESMGYATVKSYAWRHFFVILRSSDVRDKWFAEYRFRCAARARFVKD